MYLGIDLGGINIAVGLVDEDGKILSKGSTPTEKLRPASEIIADMAELCKKVTKDAGVDISDVKSIGIGSPGIPDVKEKCIKHTVNIVNFVDVYIEKELQKFFPGMPVYLENDANAAAYGEIIAGAAKEMDTAVIVTIGTGVGSGVVIDNKLFAGFNHAASEIGHMVIKYDGKPCNCGRRGCFEVYASATALIEQTKEKMLKHPDSKMYEISPNLDDVNGKTAFVAAKMGDEAAKEVVMQFVSYLGIGVCNIINVFQPEAVVIGGGISKEGDYLLNPLRDYVKENAYIVEGIPSPQIIAAKLGNDAGIIGAAMLFKQYE